jgi:hypothetical protein
LPGSGHQFKNNVSGGGASEEDNVDEFVRSRHSRAGGNPGYTKGIEKNWIPIFTGMFDYRSSLQREFGFSFS